MGKHGQCVNPMSATPGESSAFGKIPVSAERKIMEVFLAIYPRISLFLKLPFTVASSRLTQPLKHVNELKLIGY